MSVNSLLRSYRPVLLILLGIVVGSILGVWMGAEAAVLKPVGTIFLNLLYTVVVPLVFVSIAGAVANIGSTRRLGKILGTMLMVFILTGTVASCVMLLAVYTVPPAQGVNVAVEPPDETKVPPSLADQIVSTFTVNDFSSLFSKSNLLPLIVFAILFGLATVSAGDAGRSVARGLNYLSDVIMRLVGIIMLLAPIGLGAYFAALVGEFGPELLGNYARAMAVYYPVSIIYFFLAFTAYAFIAGGKTGLRSFWTAIIPPALTALGTGSSVATIPSNLAASKKIGVPRDIREMIIPIGATIHMEGSCLSAILKIAFLFGLYNMPFDSAGVFATAVGVALLSGTVMAGIPGGGFVGELIIVNLYGFPPESILILAVLGTLVDPPATMVNATGDTVTGMLVARILQGKRWATDTDPESAA